jgi:hypothetical protein
MALDREALTLALLDRLKAALPEIKFTSRRPIGWDQVPEQPALILVKENEQAASTKGQPTVWSLTFSAVIYTQNSEDPDEAPETAQNEILKAVEAALERTKGEKALADAMFMDAGDDPRTTLGGRCSHAWINGTVEADGGGLGKQGVMLIPIEILATG